MTVVCATATWPEKRMANAARRAIKRIYKANTTVYLCGLCDRYHAKVQLGPYPVSESWQRVLQCLAQGMTLREISVQTNLKFRSVEWAIEKMSERFYALNRPHLVAIAIALGIVDPNTFVPQVEECTHDESSA